MAFFGVAYNIGLAAAIIFAIWVTKSPWPILGFFMAMTLKRESNRKCEKCGG